MRKSATDAWIVILLFGSERQQDFTFGSMDSKSTVVVTGFGPFRQHLVNSSWEAVKELSKRGLGKTIDLHIMQLPVVYQKAKEQVFKIWTTLQPLVSFLISCYSRRWEKTAYCSCWAGFICQSNHHPWAVWEEQRLQRDGCLWFSPRRWLLHARWSGKDWIYN